MSSRTTTSFVTFLHPFVVAGYTDELPAGEYEVLADDEVMLSNSFAAYRRTATFLLINLHAGKSELRAVDHRDLELALAQDQANPNTNEIKNSAAALSPSEDQKMTFPEWTKPGVYGALVGAVAVSILGFTWGGWTTAGSADEMAQSFAADEVTLAMVPVCLNLSKVDTERAAKLATLQEASSFQRRNAMMETGWATLPGTDNPSRDLAAACLAGLELDGS